MANVLIVLAEGLLGRFCSVYSTMTPSVSVRHADIGLRKLTAQNGNDSVVYWIHETTQSEVESTLLISLIGVIDTVVPEMMKVVLVGFPSHDFQIPEWLVNVDTAGALECEIGLKVGLTNRFAIEQLFGPTQQPVGYTEGSREASNDYIDRLASMWGVMGPTRRTLIFSDEDNNNHTIQPPQIRSLISELGSRELIPQKRRRNVQTDEEKAAKKRSLLSKLKLADEKKDTDETSNACCCCFETFYSVDGENEVDEEDVKVYGGGVFVVPIALVPCQHRLCIGCIKNVRDKLKNLCPLCKHKVEGWETYHCVSCLIKEQPQRGPNIVVVRPCEHRVWCKDCANEALVKDDPKCPVCDLAVDDVRVAKEWK